jgi:disulfide bond formation protein DsbB
MTSRLTARLLVTVAGLGSAALLAGAFAFQYIGGMAPCALCLWQRWPHAAAVAIMLLALLVPTRWLMALGALAALTTAAVAGFHVGVEQGWWEGLSTCTGAGISGISVNDLLNPDAAVAAPVRCDQIPWSMLGVSMAGWNMILSLGLAGLWGAAATRN